ncbi:MAG: YqgE/AlgH family protein [Alphaproteobacteria bacterium]|nr:YqgE/AlgH family protein [Alphaproteobacteria bacterium]
MDDTDNTYLSGKLLLAMPHMGDPRFHKAAILVCAHDEKGAMGIVVNHTLPGLEFGNLLEDLEIQSDIHLPESLSNIPVMCGGPVEIARGFLVHGDDFKQNDTIEIEKGLNVTGTLDAIEAMVDGSIPSHLIFALGYAGWTAGQLEQEIKDNVWMVTPATSSLIFDTQTDQLWDVAMSTIGIDPHLLTEQSGQA